MNGNSAVLVTDVDGFTGVRLRFPYDAEHPTLQVKRHPVLLREWVKDFPGAKWDTKTKAWIIPDVTDIPRGSLTAAGFITTHPDGSRAVPSDLTRDIPPPVPLAIPDAAHCELPKWFGLPLYPYQLAGAIDVVLGKRILADAPGVGKTRTSLAAAAMLGASRILVLCPPVVTTHWVREITASGIPAHLPVGPPVGPPADPPLRSAPGENTINQVPPEDTRSPGANPRLSNLTTKQQNAGQSGIVESGIVVVKTGAKQPELPRSGVVVASAALVANRPALARELAEWRPEVFIYDEAHGAKTWGSRRSRVFRRLAKSCSVTIPTTGTPMMASPLELAPLLDMTWMLGTRFGSYLDFRDTYTHPTKWGWKPNRDALPQLRSILELGLWVRRTKEDVLSDMPPKVRNAIWVDVPLAAYEAALEEVYAVIAEWVEAYRDEAGHLPDDDTITEWCSGQLSLVARLRQAAGLAKVPAATDLVADWLQANPGAPIVLWAHHKTVVAALVTALQDHLPTAERVAVIDGSVPEEERASIVDAFQAGRVRVLVCSIQAAGVGITLTRSSEAVFVETDWTPALMAQAEDRQHRIGQEHPVTYTTLVASGTLDERVQAVLATKARTLDAVMDGDHRVGVQVNGRLIASDILRGLVDEVIAKRRPRRASAA